MSKIFKLFGIIFFAGATIGAKNFTTYQKVDAISPAKTVTGDIYGDGEYYIFNSDMTKALSLDDGTKQPINVDIEDAMTFDFKFSEGHYSVSSTYNGVEYFLGTSNTNTGLKTITSSYNSKTVVYKDWIYIQEAQRLYVQIDETYRRYLGLHDDPNIWRTNNAMDYAHLDSELMIIRKDIYEGFVNEETKASLKLSYSYEEETYNISNIGLRFGGAITKSLKDNLDLLDKNITYGVKYSYTPEGGSEISSKTTLAKYVTSFGAYEECDKNEANFYQFFMSINKFPLNQLNTVITARCYILIENDGFNTEYLMKEKAYSVKEMCEVYLGSSSPLSDEEKTTYSGVLNHLITEASK